MQEKTAAAINEAKQEDNGYAVFIVDMKWDTKHPYAYSFKKDRKAEGLPEQYTFYLPESILKAVSKRPEQANDIIESFVYGFLTRKFGFELSHCQIWLPLEDDEATC